MDRQTNNLARDQSYKLLAIVLIRVKNCISIGLYSSQQMPLIRFVAALFLSYGDFPYYLTFPFYPSFPYVLRKSQF